MDKETMQKAADIINKYNKKNNEQNAKLKQNLASSLKTALGMNLMDTLVLDYHDSTAFFSYITSQQNETKCEKFNMTAEEYNNVLTSVLGIDLKQTYVSSITNTIEGTSARIYTVLPPVTKHPLVTISTIKPIPDKEDLFKDDDYLLEALGDEKDSLFKEIVNGTFIIAGQSGSGKTYLMNELLHNYTYPTRHIGLIEEFNEIIPPNEYTVSMTTPPPKPGEKSLLGWATQASNLMRLDQIVVGEVKGAESWPFLMNCASGTKGACTVHGNTTDEAINRMVVLASLDPGSNRDAAYDFITSSVDYMIVMRKHRIFEIKQILNTRNKSTVSTHGEYANTELMTDLELEKYNSSNHETSLNFKNQRR